MINQMLVVTIKTMLVTVSVMSILMVIMRMKIIISDNNGKNFDDHGDDDVINPIIPFMI